MCSFVSSFFFLLRWLTHFSVHYIILGRSQGLMGVGSEINSNTPIWSIKSHSVPRQGLFLYGTIYSSVFIMYIEGKMEKERAKVKKMSVSVTCARKMSLLGTIRSLTIVVLILIPLKNCSSFFVWLVSNNIGYNRAI